MRLTTPRDVVLAELDHDHLTRQRLDRALRRLSAKGWVWSYLPSPNRPDEPLALIRKDGFLAELVGMSWDAAAAGGDRVAAVPRRTVNAELKLDLRDPYAGRLLANAGLVLRSVDMAQVELVGTNPPLARIINDMRYPRQRPLPRLSEILVHAALGLGRRPKRLTDTARSQTVRVLAEHGIEVEEPLVGGRRVHLHSSWYMPNPRNKSGVIARIRGGVAEVVR